jgi:hypothetical protein
MGVEFDTVSSRKIQVGRSKNMRARAEPGIFTSYHYKKSRTKTSLEVGIRSIILPFKKTNQVEEFVTLL